MQPHTPMLVEGSAEPSLLNGEKLFTFPQIAKCSGIPGHRGNDYQSPSTYFRWATRGVRVSGGPLIKLQAVRAGGRWLTSREAVGRFLAALTAASTPPADPSPPLRSPGQRSRASALAAAELDAFGVR